MRHVITSFFKKGKQMKLIKWIRENYIAESESEESEKVMKCSDYEQKRKKILTQSIEKRLLCAVAAPYRVVTFGDWFTFFKETPESRNYLPVHLHTFGSELDLTEELKNKLKESLLNDFQVVDRSSALRMCEEIATVNWRVIKEKVDQVSEEERETGILYLQQSELGAAYAMLLAVSCHSLTSAVDVGYLEEAEALETVEEMLGYFPQVFDSWKEYGERFLQGNRRSSLNSMVGQRVLKKYLGYLNTKSGSPWQWLSINEVNSLKWVSKTTLI